MVSKLNACVGMLGSSFAKQSWDILPLEGATNAKSLYLVIIDMDLYKILFACSRVMTQLMHTIW